MERDALWYQDLLANYYNENFGEHERFSELFIDENDPTILTIHISGQASLYKIIVELHCDDNGNIWENVYSI